MLTLTLPSNVSHRISSASASLQNPSLLSSTSTALTSTMSFASQSSVIPQTIDKSYRQQRRKRRKALTLSDDIPDEAKSLQYKALGAYYMCTLGMCFHFVFICTCTCISIRNEIYRRARFNRSRRSCFSSYCHKIIACSSSIQRRYMYILIFYTVIVWHQC